MSEENGKGIQNLLGLQEPLTKLIECVSTGVGKVYEPTHIKRMAKAKQEEIKLIGEALADNISLPSKYEDGKIMIDTTEVEELIKRTSNRVLYKELRKQQNIESVIAETYNLLEHEEHVTQDAVNQDWLYKFFDDVGEISDEYMQNIWSQILAGEIKAPNTYTFRTLNTLKNITKNEAILFNELMPFLIFYFNDPFIYNSPELLKKYGMYYEKLLKLEDCGLINLNGFLTINLEDGALFNYKTLCIFEGKLKIYIYALTESGKQISNLIKNNIDFNNEYFLEFCKEMKNKNTNVKFKAHEIKKIDENGIGYDNDIDLLNLQDNNLMTV